MLSRLPRGGLLPSATPRKHACGRGCRAWPGAPACFRGATARQTAPAREPRKHGTPHARLTEDGIDLVARIGIEGKFWEKAELSPSGPRLCLIIEQAYRKRHWE